MKKTLTICAAAALSLSAFGQGNISINDTVGVKISVNGVQMAQTPASGWIFDLLVYNGVGAPTVNSATDLTGASWLDSGVYGSNGTSGPRAGTVLGSTSTSTSAGNWNTPGTSAYFVVVGWSATEAGNAWATIKANILGTTGWADTSAAGVFGYSTLIGNIASATPPANGTSAWGTGGVTTGFNLAGVAPAPEPGTMALAALGGASLLLFRRRNK